MVWVIIIRCAIVSADHCSPRATPLEISALRKPLDVPVNIYCINELFKSFAFELCLPTTESADLINLISSILMTPILFKVVAI